MQRICLISDTHGLLRPQAAQVLRGADHIIHAGDICDGQVLREVGSFAPLTAVRGNNDFGAWAHHLPEATTVDLHGIRIHVIHDLAQLAITPQAAAVRVVVSGHSHQPLIAERDGVLFVNPGSAGPRRFKLPISLAELFIDGASVSARIVELSPD